MNLVIGTTTVPWRCDGTETNWLSNAESMSIRLQDLGHTVEWIAALELDARGLEPFSALLARLEQTGVPFTIWTFHIDDGSEKWRSDISGERLMRIACGRNLIQDFAQLRRASHVLFIDADLEVPPESPDRLLELDWPIVSGNVPTYGHTGPVVTQRPYRDDRDPEEIKRYRFLVNQVSSHTAGFLMVEHRLYTKLRWRWDWDAGLTDDPCYGADAAALGFPWLMRMDMVGVHPSLYRPTENLEIIRAR